LIQVLICSRFAGIYFMKLSALSLHLMAAFGLAALTARGADLKPPVAVAAPRSVDGTLTLGAGAETSSPSKPAAAAVSSPAASPTKSLPNPTINATVTEWVVFVADVSNPELNARGLFHDSLPPLVEDLRASRPAVADTVYSSPRRRIGVAPQRNNSSEATESGERPNAAEPMPIGLIRFSGDGTKDKDTAIDVQISYKNGRALGHWPRAKVRSSGLLWQDLHLAPEKGEPRKLPEGSWLESLRSGGLPIASGATRESFLLYDVELAYPLVMQVTGGKDGKYSVAHGMDAPLRDLTLYKRSADGRWQTASLPNLTKAAGFQSPTATVAADAVKAGASTTVNAVGGLLRAIGSSVRPTPATNAAPSSTDAPAAKVAAAKIKGTDMTLAAPSETDATVLAPWRAKLAEAGIAAADQEIVLKILARQALDPKRLSAVYRMDPAELDRILPLEVVPQPKKVSRIAFVVITGIDPEIGNELELCIKKLGDPSWKAREAAMAEIKKLGARAKSRLEEAAKDKDTEIAYRAEQLLASLGVDADQTSGQATGAAAPAGGFF
jgi:hypothetical protein